MLVRLFILFAVVPVIEIFLIIKAGQLIGPLSTVLLLLATSLVGAWLVRSQGVLILSRIQAELAGGRLPAAELLDGAMVLVGGTLLLTPGFFTDLLGLFFLVPFTRAVIKQVVRGWLQGRLDRGGVIIRRY